MTEPSTPAFSAICLMGASTARRTISTPTFWSSSAAFLRSAVEDLGRGADDRDAAAGKNAFFNRGAAGVQGVFDAGLLFLHRDFGRGPDVDLGDAAGELGEALLELLAVVVAGGVVDLVLELLDAALDGLLVAGAFDDRGVVLVDADLLGPAELRQLDVFELDAEFFEDRLCRR